MILIKVKDSNEGVEISNTKETPTLEGSSISLKVQNLTDEDSYSKMSVTHKSLFDNGVVKNSEELGYLILYAHAIQMQTPWYCQDSYIFEGLRKFIEEIIEKDLI